MYITLINGRYFTLFSPFLHNSRIAREGLCVNVLFASCKNTVYNAFSIASPLYKALKGSFVYCGYSADIIEGSVAGARGGAPLSAWDFIYPLAFARR